MAAEAKAPIILYSVASRTGLNITPETAAELAKVENIVAIKEASGNISQIAKIMQLTDGKLDLYSGNDDQDGAASFSWRKGCDLRACEYRTGIYP